MVKMITKVTTNMVNKATQYVVRLKIEGWQSRPSINGRAVDASILNLTTSCVVFVHNVGGHLGDHLDHHSKHIHSVHGSSPIFLFDCLYLLLYCLDCFD